MKTRLVAFLAAAALAGLFPLSAYAGDGDGEAGKTGKASGDGKAGAKAEGKDEKGADKGGCCKEKEGGCCGKEEDDDAVCGDCGDCGDEAEGAGEGKEGCKARCSDLEIVALAAVEGAGEAAKKVLSSVPAEALKKVEEARRATFDRLAEIQKTMGELRKEYGDDCAEAKAKGKELACEAKDTFARDMKTLHVKAKEQIASFSKVLGDNLGEGKVKELSAECRKAGNIAKAAASKIKAAAAKLLEKKAAVKDEDGEDDEDDDEADEEHEGKEKHEEHAKEHGKEHGEKEKDKK
jgi:hypothetical protein